MDTVNILFTYGFNVLRYIGVNVQTRNLIRPLFLIFIPGVILTIAISVEIRKLDVDEVVEMSSYVISLCQVRTEMILRRV